MIISRDRHLDDTSRLALSLVLQTRTPEMHSVLSDASGEVRDELGRILVEALDRIAVVLQPEMARRTGAMMTSSFGCGT